MRLRVSGEHTGHDYDLQAVLGTPGAEVGVAHSDVLNAFVEALCAREGEAIASARAALVQTLGEAAMVDAAAVIAAFNAYPRIADATGIPLEEAKAAASATLRAQLGLEAFNPQARSAREWRVR
jgi:hypothetical protein